MKGVGEKEKNIAPALKNISASFPSFMYLVLFFFFFISEGLLLLIKINLTKSKDFQMRT